MVVPADNPITSKSSDRLGRANVAAILADEIRSLDASQGVVAGILGPWGSGKTSLVNLVCEQLVAKALRKLSEARRGASVRVAHDSPRSCVQSICRLCIAP